MTTSQYLGSSSISRAWRPAFSQAISVEPEPPNGSSAIAHREGVTQRWVAHLVDLAFLAPDTR